MKIVAILLMLFLAGSKLCAQTIQSMEIFPDFDKGHFYTKDGKKVEGLLHFITNDPFTDKSYGACSVLYKESKRAQKHKFTTNDICCFVIGKDSFAINK